MFFSLRAKLVARYTCLIFPHNDTPRLNQLLSSIKGCKLLETSTTQLAEKQNLNKKNKNMDHKLLVIHWFRSTKRND